MFNKLIIFSFLIFLGSSNLNAAVTVVGSSDALICYKHAKYGYTTQSSVFTCLKAISDKTISKKDLDATRINLGIIYNNKSKPRLALEQFEIAFKNEKMKAEVLLNQGNSLLLLKNYKGALEKYQASYENNLEDISAIYFNKGMAHEYLGNIDKAVSFYKKAVTLNPSLIDYFENKRRKLKEAGLWNASNEREKS
jgi:tetratricopeptide (TPR) repeat protein